MTSDGRLIIREDDDENVKDKGMRSVYVSYYLTSKELVTIIFFTDKNEVEDILEEAGVKSVRFHCSHYKMSKFGILNVIFIYGPTFQRLQKKSQKRKIKDEDFDEDMDTEPGLKYKGSY